MAVWTPAPLMLALDFDTAEEAWELAQKTAGVVNVYKVGPRLIQLSGLSLIHKLTSLAPVFVDCKYHDIPSTVEAAVRASFRAGATFVTVHASNGAATLRRLAEVEQELNKQREFHILAVTVLTSLTDETLPSNWQKQSIVEHVKSLAQEVRSAGLEGLVCSADELSVVQDLGLHCITPGIRIAGTDYQDQTRVTDPTAARRRGAWAMVVGRPILQAADPRGQAKNFLRLWDAQ